MGMTNIRNECEDTAADPVELKKKQRCHSGRMYTHKFAHLDGKNQVLKNHKLPQFTYYGIGNLSSPTLQGNWIHMLKN